MSPEFDWIYDVKWVAVIIAGGGLVASFYLLIPWLIYSSQRMTGDPEIVLFDPEERRPPKRIARYLQETGETLLGLGFEPQPCVALPDPMPNVKAVTQLWIHPDRRDAALVSAIFGVSPQVPKSQQIYYTEFLSRFASEDVRVIQTNNVGTVSAFPDLPNELTFRFPMVKSVAQLERLHRKVVERHEPRARRIVSLTDKFKGDLEAYIRWVLIDSYRKQEGTGYLVRDDGCNFWRPTVKGAYLMTWSQLWPMSMILKLRMKARARQLLHELNESPE